MKRRGAREHANAQEGQTDPEQETVFMHNSNPERIKSCDVCGESDLENTDHRCDVVKEIVRLEKQAEFARSIAESMSTDFERAVGESISAQLEKAARRRGGSVRFEPL